MKKRHNLAFGAVIRETRLRLGLTQEELGFESDLDRTYISLLERGKRSPTLDTTIALCQALDVTFSQLAIRVEAVMNGEEP